MLRSGSRDGPAPLMQDDGAVTADGASKDDGPDMVEHASSPASPSLQSLPLSSTIAGPARHGEARTKGNETRLHEWDDTSTSTDEQVVSPSMLSSSSLSAHSACEKKDGPDIKGGWHAGAAARAKGVRPLPTLQDGSFLAGAALALALAAIRLLCCAGVPKYSLRRL